MCKFTLRGLKIESSALGIDSLAYMELLQSKISFSRFCVYVKRNALSETPKVGARKSLDFLNTFFERRVEHKKFNKYMNSSIELLFFCWAKSFMINHEAILKARCETRQQYHALQSRRKSSWKFTILLKVFCEWSCLTLIAWCQSDCCYLHLVVGRWYLFMIW